MTPQLYSSTVQPMISVPEASQPAQEALAIPQLHWSWGGASQRHSPPVQLEFAPQVPPTQPLQVGVPHT